MDTSYGKDLLMIKLVIYEFGCKNIFLFNVWVIVYLLSISEKIAKQ